MSEILQTIAEIAAAFAGFASVVVIFRRGDSMHFSSNTKVTFQSMLLGSLFVIFFSLLPLVLIRIEGIGEAVYQYSAGMLLVYIVATFGWGISTNREVKAGTLPYLIAALTIVASQTAALLGVTEASGMYLVGVFALLTISGYSFYSLITFQDEGGDS